MRTKIKTFRIECAKVRPNLPMSAECCIEFYAYSIFGTYLGYFKLYDRFCVSDDMSNETFQLVVHIWMRDWNRILKFRNYERVRKVVDSTLEKLDIKSPTVIWEADF